MNIQPQKPVTAQIGVASPLTTGGLSAQSKRSASLQQTIANLNTPQWIQLSLGAICVSALLSMISVINATNAQRQAFKILQKDTTPSIVNSQRVKDSLADMDATIANDMIQAILTPTASKVALGKQDEVNGASAIVADPDMMDIDVNNPSSISFILADPAATNKPLLDPVSQKILSDGFKYRQNRLMGWMTKVSENITYKEEWQPIWQLQYGIGNYLQLVQRAQDFQAQGDREGMLRTYRQAVTLLDGKLLPAADNLTKVNYDQLQIQYKKQQQTVQGNLLLILIFVGLLLGSLAWLQFFLYRRTNRILNSFLLGSSAVTVVFFLYAINALMSSDSALKTASQDAFNSIYALRQVRAIAYMANASESRYLLDRAAAPQHESDFHNRISQIFEPSIIVISQTLKLDSPTNNFNVSQILDLPKIPPEMAGGIVIDALNNVTFDGEREALKEMLQKWSRYVDVDYRIRKLATSQRLNDAIALCVGSGENQSNALFYEFRDANNKALKINDKEFANAIDRGNATVANFQILAPVAFSLVILLTILGLRPRLKEYAD
jgi:hypothetical protein